MARELLVVVMGEGELRRPATFFASTCALSWWCVFVTFFFVCFRCCSTTYFLCSICACLSWEDRDPQRTAYLCVLARRYETNT